GFTGSLEAWQPHVESFPPGHYWTPTGGLVEFAAPVPPKEELEHFEGPGEPGAEIPNEILEKVRDRLIRTVERQMMGDVPVGVFLSGGLDSSLVAAIAARWYKERGERLKTFAVGLQDSPDLEARVPFLEREMIELGLALPAGWKLAGENQPEKRLLRQAFDGWLPDDFLWRKKAQFGDGSGAASVLQEEMDASVSASRSSLHCAPARRSPTTGSSPGSSGRFAPSKPWAGSRPCSGQPRVAVSPV